MIISPDKFKNITAMIVGDVMLDRYWFGSVDRISPEAPVPVLAVGSKESRAGGAANVANNIAVLGAKAKLISVVGDDATAQELESLVSSLGTEVLFSKDSQIQTTEKLRMIAQNQQLLRADFENNPSDNSLALCLEDFLTHLPKVDVVILSDYGKGCLQHVKEMIKHANQAGKPVVVDPKGSDFSRYQGASMITPNTKEFKAVMGDFVDENDFESKAFELKKRYQLDSLLVTRSEKGMSFIQGDKHIQSAAKAREVYDVSGAGDTVIASVALGLVSDMSISERLAFANAAAGVVVGKVGTATASIDEIAMRLSE